MCMFVGTIPYVRRVTKRLHTLYTGEVESRKGWKIGSYASWLSEGRRTKTSLLTAGTARGCVAQGWRVWYRTKI